MMELFISLAIIVAIAELKDWKHSKITASLLVEINTLKQDNQTLLFDIRNAQSGIVSIQESVSSGLVKIEENNATLLRMQEFIERAEANSATVLREYELNGMPLGYQRKHPDFIEGL